MAAWEIPKLNTEVVLADVPAMELIFVEKITGAASIIGGTSK